MYDYSCDRCGGVKIDVFEPVESPVKSCASPGCGGTLRRAWISKPPAAIPDDIPGGIYIKHGLCHEDGTPRRYDSKSEIAREAKRRNLTNYVVHETAGTGSDKSPHTSRWI